jgi:hypothetical protein
LSKNAYIEASLINPSDTSNLNHAEPILNDVNIGINQSTLIDNLESPISVVAPAGNNLAVPTNLASVNEEAVLPNSIPSPPQAVAQFPMRTRICDNIVQPREFKDGMTRYSRTAREFA